MYLWRWVILELSKEVFFKVTEVVKNIWDLFSKFFVYLTSIVSSKASPRFAFAKRDRLTYKFIFPLILNQLSIDIPQDSEEIIQILSNVFILCLLIFFSFLNILKDAAILYLVYKYSKNIEEKLPLFLKYPALKKYPLIKWILERVLKRYTKLSLFFILFEILFIFFLLALLLVFCYLKINLELQGAN